MAARNLIELENDKMTRNSTASNSFGSDSQEHRKGKRNLKMRALLGGKIVENPTMFEEI